MYLGWWPIRTHYHFCTFQAGTSEGDKRDQCQDDDGHTRIWPQSCCISSQSNLHEVAVRQDATISDVPNNLSTNAGLKQLLILISQGHVIEGRVSFANLVANQRQEWWAGFHYDLFAAKLRCWILLEICEHVVLARSCFFVRLHNYRSRYFYRESIVPKDTKSIEFHLFAAARRILQLRNWERLQRLCTGIQYSGSFKSNKDPVQPADILWYIYIYGNGTVYIYYMFFSFWIHSLLDFSG